MAQRCAGGATAHDDVQQRPHGRSRWPLALGACDSETSSEAEPAAQTKGETKEGGAKPAAKAEAPAEKDRMTQICERFKELGARENKDQDLAECKATLEKLIPALGEAEWVKYSDCVLKATTHAQTGSCVSPVSRGHP